MMTRCFHARLRQLTCWFLYCLGMFNVFMWVLFKSLVWMDILDSLTRSWFLSFFMENLEIKKTNERQDNVENPQLPP